MQRLAEELGVRERDDSFCCQVGLAPGCWFGWGRWTIVTPKWNGVLLLL
jgi:hypothetical protein